MIASNFRHWPLPLLVLLGALVFALGEGADRPDLHLILDTTLCLTTGMITVLLAPPATRPKAGSTACLPLCFGFAAVLYAFHALTVLPWIANPALGLLGSRLRPATWPPASYILPFGIALALARAQPVRRGVVAAALGALTGVLIWVFLVVLPYSAPTLLGITRPTLTLVPLAWTGVLVLSWRRRRDDEASLPLFMMSLPLGAAHTIMLFSRSAHDTLAMVAHMGAIAGFLGFLLHAFQRGISDLEERTLAEQRARQINEELEQRVKERTARIEAATLMLVEENTERRRAEDAARASEAQLRSFVEQAPVPIAIFDRSMSYLATSRRWLAEFGRGHHDLAGLNHYEVHPDIPEAWKEVHRQALQGASLGADEDAWTRADGTTVWLRWAVQPWRNHQGAIGGIMILSEDISERKETQATLLEERALLRTVFDLLPDYIYAKDRDGRFLAVNRACARHMGAASGEELLGKSDADYYPADRAAEFRRDEERVLSGVPLINKDEGYTRPDGTRRSILTTKVPLTDGRGGIRGLVGTGRDITEREQAERRLATQYSVTRVLSEASSLAEAAPGLIQAICETLGGQFGALWEIDRQANVLRCANLWHAADLHAEGLVAQVRRAALAPGVGLPGRVWESGKPVALQDVLTDPASPHATEAARAGLHGALGFPIVLRGEVAGVIDFLGRELRRPEADLMALLGALGIQIGQFVEHRQANALFVQAQKLEAVGQLAGGIAHDFNNLLAVILGYVELARKDLPEDHKARRRVDGIQKAAERAAALTRQILTFSRKEQAAVRVLDLNRIVEDMEKMLRRLIGEDIRLTVVPGAELGRVRADPSQIEQVIMNLAVNARDAMPRGGRMVIETSNVSLDASSPRTQAELRPGPHVLLAVSDTGEGMSAETRARLFEPFFTTKRQGKGTGLGLAVVYGIVKQSGGSISVYSEPGRGSTFKVYLPRVDAVETAVAPVPDEARGGSETILLVEDEDALRLVAAEVLRNSGYDVLVAKDVATATVAAAGHPGIDLVVTDVVLPGGSGPEVVRNVKATHPKAKVLLVSGYTDGLLNGEPVDGETPLPFLGKPFTIDVLLRKVREVLEAAGG